MLDRAFFTAHTACVITDTEWLVVGHSGAAVARMGKAFGMRVVCWGRAASLRWMTWRAPILAADALAAALQQGHGGAIFCSPEAG